MIRAGFIAAIAAFMTLPLDTALARRQLAIGEAIPVYVAPGHTARPVFVRPVLHSRWTPVDTSFDIPFREPIYSTPRGYVYRYVSGYEIRRVSGYGATRIHKARIHKAHRTSAKRVHRSRPVCVTEMGYGHYYLCH